MASKHGPSCRPSPEPLALVGWFSVLFWPPSTEILDLTVWHQGKTMEKFGLCQKKEVSWSPCILGDPKEEKYPPAE